MVNSKEYGAQGEELAARALKKQKYRILARNYRQKCGEIDIIAEKNGVVYFVEVKAKHDTTYTTPADRVNAAKRRHIANTATIWLAEHGDTPTSFLVAEVALPGGEVFFIEDFLV